MWTVPRPPLSTRETYLLCVSKVRQPALRAALQDAVDRVEELSTAFESAVVSTAVHELNPSDFSIPPIDDRQFKINYDSRMVHLGGPGRPVYDFIRTSAEQARCPLCGHRDVRTVDHHLTKKCFVALSVDPINLVPACSDCNHIKLDFVPTAAEEETLHPYFDDIESVEWLVAAVQRGAPPSVRFSVRGHPTWDSVLAQRVQSHFEMFGLPELYAIQAARELRNLSKRLNDALSDGGQAAVRKYLVEEGESRRRARTNSWQTALYDALARDDWFTKEGLTGI